MTNVMQTLLDRQVARQTAHEEKLRALRTMKDRTWQQMRRAVGERLGLPLEGDNDDDD